MGYKHIKLDKIVAGNEQRIFKTNIHDILSSNVQSVNNLDALNVGIVQDISDKQEYHKFDTIYYGEYSTDLKTENKLNGNTLFDKSLLHFNDVNSEYITNKESNIVDVSVYNTEYSSWFKSAVNESQKNSLKSSDERITYFPNTLKMPIDISISDNRAYMLNPINTDKYTNLIQNSTNLSYKNFSVSANYKDNYQQMFSDYLSRAYYYAEDNNIPIYDLNFSAIQTINFNSKANVDEWLNKWNLYNFIQNNNILFNSNTNLLNDYEYDSIYLQNLLTTLSLNDVSNTYDVQSIIYDLFAHIDINSIIRAIQPIGAITTVSQDVVDMILSNKTLSTSFLTTSGSIINSFYQTQPYTFLSNELPKNSMFLTNLNESLGYYTNNSIIKSSLKTTDGASNPPSSYLDFMYLKNSQNPHYNYDLNIEDPSGSLKDFKIYTDTKEYVQNSSNNPMSAYISKYENDKSKEFNDLHDFDGTMSLRFNSSSKYKNITTKRNTISILNSAIIADNQLAENDEKYKNKFNERISTKTNNYLDIYKNRHIITNKIYDIGETLGFRNYIHTGNVLGTGKIWTSYKYIVSYDQNFLNLFVKNIYLEYINYETFRYENHMEKDVQNNVLYEGIDNVITMKTENSYCPYSFKNNANINGLTNFQNIVGCTLAKNQECRGFCPFPTNEKCIYNISGEYIPTGLIWNITDYKDSKDILETSFTTFNSVNKEWTIIDVPSSISNETKFMAKTNINVYDDFEIYFIDESVNISSNTLLINEISQLLDNNKEMQYKSLFRGFGGLNENNKCEYPEYQMINSNNIETINDIECIPASTYINSLRSYVKLYNITDSTYRVKNLLSSIFMSTILSSYISTDTGELNVSSDFDYDTFSNYLNSSTYYGILVDQSKYKNLSSFFEYTIADYENTPKRLVSAIVDNNVIYKTLGEIYNDSLSIYISDIINEFPEKNKINNTNILYNGFVIAPNSPFNGPHCIMKNTIFNAYYITKNNDELLFSDSKTDKILANSKILLRIRNWWSDIIGYSGEFELIPYNEITIENYKEKLPNYNKIFNTISNYDHIEHIKGLLKFQQNDIKKSNIYSIQLQNSGLNPQNDIVESNYNNFEYLLEADYWLLETISRNMYYSEYWNTIINDNSNLIDDVVNCIYNNNSVGYTSKANLLSYLNNNNPKIYIFDTSKASLINNTRSELREIVENAIKNSVKRYMPVHTSLWKILYTGK